jgi:hypothetical protein
MAAGVRPPTCSWASLVDRHFAGRIQPEHEAELRGHLPDCQACHQRYDRHLLLADLSRHTGLGGAPLAREDRLAIGLGLPPRPGSLPAVRHWPVLGMALALGVLALLITRGDGSPRRSDEPFSAPQPVAASAPQTAAPAPPDAGLPDGGGEAGTTAGQGATATPPAH